MNQSAVEWLMTKLQSLGVTKEEHYELLCQLELEAKAMEQRQKGYSLEEVIILLKSRITEIHLRKDNLLKNKDTMPQHLLEGGILGFQSSMDAIGELVMELTKHQES